MHFAVIGNPISHSLSPAMHGAAYRALGLDHTYVARLTEDLNADIDLIKQFDGVNVTVPHKESMLAHCRPDAFAQRAGAVNTVDWRTGRGINTDGPGFVDILPPGAERVFILGAGGTTRALALALALAGKEVTIWNRTPARAEAIVNELAIPARVSLEINLHGQDLIVNATSASLAGQRLPLDWGQAESGAVAFDLGYGKEPTLFETDAAAAGLKTIDGRELLIAQGARSFTWWLGIEAPIEAMRNAVYGRGERERAI